MYRVLDYTSIAIGAACRLLLYNTFIGADSTNVHVPAIFLHRVHYKREMY